jgi:alkane 1-monooxygenase
MVGSVDLKSVSRAAPFWASLAVVPLAWIGGVHGGWTVLLMPVGTWWLFTGLDALIGHDLDNADPDAPEADLFWYRLVTLIWPPVQFATLFGLIAWVTWTDHLSIWEELGVFLGMGILSGTIGIVYAHELMHQKSRLERWLGDILMAMALYGHFRSEHLLVHHRHVGTPYDAVTARYNEGFHRFFIRVLPQCLISAFRAERAMLARKGLPWWDRSNPFWRYATLASGFILLSLLIGGWAGVGFFAFQALVAVWQLELVNYVEHYGLVRKHIGGGKYEPVRPCHSWNAAHKASNRLLINLQRHPDHHARPDRRFPLLQNHGPDEAPQLPFGYPVMTLMALVPPLWRRVMNPRVRKWRAMFYPEITEWRASTLKGA